MERRYAPFFQTPSTIIKLQMDVYGMALFAGTIHVQVKGAHGLESVRPGSFLSCTLSLQGAERADQAVVNREVQKRTFSVEILKAGTGGSIGLLLEMPSRGSKACKIETLKPGAPASATELRVSCRGGPRQSALSRHVPHPEWGRTLPPGGDGTDAGEAVSTNSI